MRKNYQHEKRLSCRELPIPLIKSLSPQNEERNLYNKKKSERETENNTKEDILNWDDFLSFSPIHSRTNKFISQFADHQSLLPSPRRLPPLLEEGDIEKKEKKDCPTTRHLFDYLDNIKTPRHEQRINEIHEAASSPNKSPKLISGNLLRMTCNILGHHRSSIEKSNSKTKIPDFSDNSKYMLNSSSKVIINNNISNRKYINSLVISTKLPPQASKIKHKGRYTNMRSTSVRWCSPELDSNDRNSSLKTQRYKEIWNQDHIQSPVNQSPTPTLGTLYPKHRMSKQYLNRVSLLMGDISKHKMKSIQNIQKEKAKLIDNMEEMLDSPLEPPLDKEKFFLFNPLTSRNKGADTERISKAITKSKFCLEADHRKESPSAKASRLILSEVSKGKECKKILQERCYPSSNFKILRRKTRKGGEALKNCYGLRFGGVKGGGTKSGWDSKAEAAANRNVINTIRTTANRASVTNLSNHFIS